MSAPGSSEYRTGDPVCTCTEEMTAGKPWCPVHDNFAGTPPAQEVTCNKCGHLWSEHTPGSHGCSRHGGNLGIQCSCRALPRAQAPAQEVTSSTVTYTQKELQEMFDSGRLSHTEAPAQERNE